MSQEEDADVIDALTSVGTSAHLQQASTSAVLSPRTNEVCRGTAREQAAAPAKYCLDLRGVSFQPPSAAMTMSTSKPQTQAEKPSAMHPSTTSADTTAGLQYALPYTLPH